MTSTAVQYSDSSSGTRRSASRYPIDTDVHYRVSGREAVLRAGRGRTINISSNGILIETEQALPLRTRIDLSISWPARLNNVTPLQLYIQAKTVRAEGCRTAARILRHEFRTRPGVQAIRPEAVHSRDAVNVSQLQTRLNACFEDVSKMAVGGIGDETRAVLRTIVNEYRAKLDRLALTLPL